MKIPGVPRQRGLFSPTNLPGALSAKLPGGFSGTLPGLSPLQSHGIPTRPLATFAFAPNPGALVAKKFVPSNLPANAPLVVVLHGCTQTPEGYDRGTGWTHLAERHGFVVLFAEQQRGNNMNLCFNWFEPGDIRRGAGEPASIDSMIAQIVADHGIDPARIHITGLSAGAAMAGVMLATYPERFAGGGLIAGLPYGVARSVPAAFSRMRSRGTESDSQLGALVRRASEHEGPWPTVSIWHGDADATVHADNSGATVAQWLELHGLREADANDEVLDGHVHRTWRDDTGRTCVEEYVIAGMGHGTPLDPSHPENAEVAGAYLLDVGVSSSQRLAATWGLTATVANPAVEELAAVEPQRVAVAEQDGKALSLPRPEQAAHPSSRRSRRPTPQQEPQRHAARDGARPDVGKIITDALRSAGLMK